MGYPRLEPDDRLRPRLTRLCPLLRAGHGREAQALRPAQVPERWARRSSGPGFAVTLHPQTLTAPLRWRKPRIVFVNSMSDLFHEEIPFDYIEQVFDVMVKAPQHTFQILTKRDERLAELADQLPWPGNVWIGVSVENRRFVHRADQLRRVPAAVRFVSAEPLLGPLEELNLAGIDWLIAGGESGTTHRPVRESWVTALRDQCVAEEVAFFFKQWGGCRPTSGGRLLEGREWSEMPRGCARESHAAVA